jgi:glycosyltransferase involved in cell wall biosynthesis
MKRPIRILAICQEDPEWILGGMGRHIAELYRSMGAREDVAVDLLVNGPDEYPKNFHGCTKYYSDKLVCWKPTVPNISSILISDIQMIRTVCKLIAQGKRWDLVHCHEWNSVQTSRVVRDSLNIPMVGTMHLCISKLMQGVDLPEHMREKGTPNFSQEDIFLMQQEGHLIMDSNELILCSYSYEDVIREVFLTKRPINVIYNGIRPEDWKRDFISGESIRKKYNLPDRPIALFVGRIADMKGIRPLLESIEMGDTGFCVVLCGEVNANTEHDKENWEVTKLIRKTVKKYPERLQWVGFQKNKDLKAFYSIAQIGVMPSTHEPFGIVALEFMAMGVPVIATEIEGLGEIVVNGREEYAMIIDTHSSVQIYEAMKYLFNNPQAREELSQLGYKRLKDFDWDVAADKTIQVYKKAIHQHKIINMERKAS